MIYVLDACAMIAYLNDEPGAEVVEATLIEPANQCLAHAPRNFNLNRKESDVGPGCGRDERPR